MVIDYFNGYTRARSFGIAAHIKIMGEPSLIFLVYGLVSIFECLQKVQDCVMEEKNLKISKFC
jgi:hypothetical protein